MVKRMLIIAAVINLCLTTISYAANIVAQNTHSTQTADLMTFGKSSQTESKSLENAKADLNGVYVSAPSRCKECHNIDNIGGYNTISVVGNSDEACDWCHSEGAASMCAVSLDNDDMSMAERSVGHSRGFGVDTGKWQSPDDTYPAFTPKYWRGGMSCLDCHPAHNYKNQTFSHSEKITLFSRALDSSPKTILKLNPDREVDRRTGLEIPDSYEGNYSSTLQYPTNTISINWDSYESLQISSPEERLNVINRMCVDCHDGNVGLHDTVNLVFSEDSALRGKSGLDAYVRASAHDARPERCQKETIFDPEDGLNHGPDCRSCHSGSSDCDICHALSKIKKASGVEGLMDDSDSGSAGSGKADSGKQKNAMADLNVSPDCISLGISWPHRTLGWKMLKDELFGIDYDGREIRVGQLRRFSVEKVSLTPSPAQDLDSVCLDCHNSAVWNPASKETFIKGLP
ncbi:MAG: hypothetical protein K6T91_07375 [Firmicutes bacterium]|nr:hypothetical protein [Bacillota bacterium]